MSEFPKDSLIFLPLGGSNEIGMNVNLYHYEGKWLMIDLGAGFADEYFPGVQMLAPDLSFLYENRDDFLGLVLTHAHEDHIGSVGYLWDRLRCPIYATPFTAGMARSKLRERNWLDQAELHEVKPGSAFQIGPFNLEMIQITHSIPEMNGIVLRTKYGNVLHTGDWKLDPDPVVGPVTEEDRLRLLGGDGNVLAMVCDSTNVFNDRVSGSEGALLEGISGLVAQADGLVVVTTFASNVGRLKTIAQAAHRNGRAVFLAGWSLRRIESIARETGYLDEIDPFISENEIKRHARKNLLVICTGCQGEPNAAIRRMADGTHPVVRLTPKDTVIFSSKIIPGNEKKIFRLFNRFVRLGCEVFTEKDHNVHVSGHPSRAELKRMYEMVKPRIAIPVHGEPMHLHEHVKLAKELGIPSTVQIQNGEAVQLAPGEPKSLRMVKTGYLAVDGLQLHPAEGEVMKMRRRMRDDGLILATVILDSKGGLACEPDISTPGLMDERGNRDFLEDVREELVDVIDAQRDTSEDHIYQVVRKTLQRVFKKATGKNPPIQIQVARV